MTSLPPDATAWVDQSLRRFLEQGRSVTLVAVGGSMFPTLVAGSLVALDPHPGRRPLVGEIVAVGRPDGGLALHRVVSVLDDGRALTWGDALPSPDAWTPAPVLAWVRIIHTPWRPSAWRRGLGGVRVQSHLWLGRWRSSAG